MWAPLDLKRDFPSVVRTLPPFPQIVLQLLDLLRDEDSSIERLAKIAQKDAVISGNILACANRVRRVHGQSDLDDPFAAASLIGLNRVRAIVVTTGMNRFLAAGGADEFMFRHSLAVAIAAQELAMLCGVSPETAYVLGILHDVGQLCFCQADAKAFEEVYAQASLDGRLLEREEAAFGIDHCLMGSMLADHWNLPQEFCYAIQTHHDDTIVIDKLQATICLAETLARALDIPPSTKNRVTRINAPALDALGLSWDSLDAKDCFGRCRARYRLAVSGG